MRLAQIMHITKDMKLAMARYYLNRSLQTQKHWDKKADLDNISKVAHQWDFSCNAIAGEFQFQKPRKWSNVVITCNQDNFLDGGEKMVYASMPDWNE